MLPAFNAARPGVEYSQHPNGRAHTADTIRKMAELATLDQASYPIRRLATSITHHVPSKDVIGELFALYCWVRDHIRYRFDPVGVEWLQRPQRTAYELAGDCDDMATLLAALAGSLGHRWRFYTVGATSDIDEHIAVQIFVAGQWFTLDPVLEPQQRTTAPRKDIGTFGRTAPGPSHVWNSEGRMLSGPTTLADRQLWDWVPYYPPVPPTGNLIPPMPGAYTTPDTRYRSANAPGYLNGKPIRLAFGIGEPAPPVHLADGLGRIPYTHKGRPGYLLGATGVKTSAADMAIARWSINKAKGPKAEAAKKWNDQQVSAYWEGLSADQRKAIRAVAPHASILQELSNVAKVALPIASAFVPALAPLAVVANVASGAAKLVSEIHVPHAELAKKYSSAARQLFKNGFFFVYEPANLKGFRPAISFSLGATETSTKIVGVMPTTQQSQAARDMVSALTDYQRNNGKPLYGKGVHVLAFQKTLTNLGTDGEYGPNVQKAAAWAVGMPVSSMPAFDARYAKYPLTWKEPTKRVTTPSTTQQPSQPTQKPPAQQPAKKPAPQQPAAAQKTQPAAKPPPTPPAVPGMKPVGIETKNPGLPPAGAKKVANKTAPTSTPASNTRAPSGRAASSTRTSGSSTRAPAASSSSSSSAMTAANGGGFPAVPGAATTPAPSQDKKNDWLPWLAAWYFYDRSRRRAA